MNQTETKKIVLMLRTAWPRTPVDDIDMMVNVYHLGLRNVSFEEAEQAVAECIESCTFMPTVAELRERMPKRPMMDPALYRRFHALRELPNRTADQQREFVTVCRRLGIPWAAGGNVILDVEALPA